MKEKPLISEKAEGGIVVRSYAKKDGSVNVSYMDKPVHNIVIGTTGSGKTQSIIIPSILSIGTSNASMIINDPKGELYSLTSEYLRSLGYKTYIMNYNNPMSGTCFNQLFLINEQYDKGLPHFWAINASRLLIKLFKFIQTGGDECDLEYFDVKSFKGNVPPQYAPLMSESDRSFSSGRDSQARRNVIAISKLGKVENPVVQKLADLPIETAINFVRDIITNCYAQIQEAYLKEKEGELTDILYNNKYLKTRQEHLCQAAVDILSILSIENITKYYQAKIDHHRARIEEMEKQSQNAKNMEQYIRSEAEIAKAEKVIASLKEKWDIDAIIKFLEDSQYDHEVVWSECEGQATTLAGNIAGMIVGNDTPGGDKFWNQTAKALITSLILLVCRESDAEYSKHLGSVYRILSSLSEPINDKQTPIDKIFGRMKDGDPCKLTQTAMRAAGDKTKSSILVSGIAEMDIFSKPEIIDQCARHQFNPQELVDNKTAVFLIAPGADDAGLAQFSLLATLFIEQAYSCLNMNLSRTKELTCKRPVHFLIDEAANMPPIPNLHNKITLARSKNMIWTLCFQSFEQIKSSYKDGYATIKENTNCYYLLTNSMDTAEEISKRLGKETIEINSYSKSSNDKGTNSSTNTSTTGRELMTPQEIMQLKEEEALYLMLRQQPYKTHLERAYKWEIYKWLKANEVENINVRRDPDVVNYFCPDYVDFTAAYELTVNYCLIDKFVFNLLSSLG